PGFFALRGPGALPGLPDPLVELFVRDVTEGIQGTGIKAAFFKCAIDHHGLTAGVERVLRAVAQAHAETGAPIMVHNRPADDTMAEVRRVLGEEGVEPRHVLLAHVGDSPDVDLLSRYAEEGFLLGMDRFGIDAVLPFDQRVETVAELCRRGYSSRLVLAHDASCYIDWIQPDLKPALPNWHYLHIHNDVLPELLARGVTDEQIDEMLVASPRAWFERRCPGRRGARPRRVGRGARFRVAPAPAARAVSVGDPGGPDA